MAIESINPATGQQLEAFAPFRPEHVHALLDEAREAYLHWRQETFAARSERLTALAKVLRSRKAELARTATLEMGKSILEAEAEVEKCAWCCDFFAQHAEGYLADQQLPSTASESYVGCRPLGVVLAIMPWNFPYWQVFRFAAPALMAGNTAVLKHASNVSRCALEVERAFVDAGFPHGIFRTLLLPGAETAELIGDPRIAAVTLTGSTQAGSAAAAASGRQIKKHVLELGGSDAFIVLEDADIEAAAAVGVRARYQNCGQSCIAAKRFILAERIADQFLQAFTTGVRALRVGDPLDRAVQVGPLARADLRDALERQVQESVSAGATLALGGHCVPGPGAFYEPTILTGVEPGMPAFDEETFGPAAAMVIAPRCRPRGGAGQQFRLRVGREPLDARHRSRSRAGQKLGMRRAVHQRHDGVRAGAALRRREAQWLRPRAVRLRHPRICESANGVDWPTHAGASPRSHNRIGPAARPARPRTKHGRLRRR